MFMWLFASANKRKKGKKFKIEDFVPTWGRATTKTSGRRQWSSKEIWDFMVAIADSMPDDKKELS